MHIKTLQMKPEIFIILRVIVEIVHLFFEHNELLSITAELTAQSSCVSPDLQITGFNYASMCCFQARFHNIYSFINTIDLILCLNICARFGLRAI